MLYHVYNLAISSNHSLRGLPVTPENEPDLTVEFSSFIGSFQTLSNRFMQWNLPEGEPWLSCAKTDSGYLLRFNELADFTIDRDGREIVCRPRSGIPDDTLQHLLLDQVIPLVINLRGGEALHASAILTPRGVVAFAGPAGVGKSTIAASLMKMGYPFVSDDCLTFLEKDQNIYAIPAYPGLRLWDDARTHLFGENGKKKSVAHYTSKLRVDVEERPDSYSTEPGPFVRLYDIMNSPEAGERSDITIEKVSSRDSFMALVRCAFRLDITDNRMLRRQFCFLEHVVSAISIRRLIFPRNFTLLPAILEAILEDLRNSGN